MHPKDADGMDQTAVWSGFTLFAQTCLKTQNRKNIQTNELILPFGSRSVVQMVTLPPSFGQI